ncbi:MAG: DUF5703 domain-containing protein [Terrimicrobiaceae bacterium]
MIFAAFRACQLSLAFLAIAMPGFVKAETGHSPSHDVIWDTPGKNSADSMPLGNGELGINLWVEENGDLNFYLSRNDSFSAISQLAKVGWVRVSLSPNPFVAGAPFRQRLKLVDGVCEITAGAPGEEVTLKVFVDSDWPVVHVLGRSGQPVTVTATVESWREEPQFFTRRGQWTMVECPTNPPQAADIFPAPGTDSVAWYHRNENSFAFEETIRVQSLEPIRHFINDPLLHRTFGGWVAARGFAPIDNRKLVSTQPVKDFHIRVASPCEQTPSAQDWLKLAESIADEAADGQGALTRTAAHWRAFWNRSWVMSDTGPGLEGDGSQGDFVASSPVGRNRHRLMIGQENFSDGAARMTIGKAHTLQRYMQAAAGRSIYPIKFNGSIFNVEPTPFGIEDTPDWRRWGDCHWWQNVRIPYHSMLATGDFDLMLPLFDTYERIRPHAEARTKLYTGAEGLHFWETMTIWGTPANRDYGWDRTDKKPGEMVNQHTGKVWNQGLELVNLMLDYYDYTGDAEFLRERILPMAMPVLKYFDTRFKKDKDGRVIIDPTQSVETYWFEVVNDTPNVAGLHSVTARLTALPKEMSTPEQRTFFAHMKAATPPIPMNEAELNGQNVRRIAVAAKFRDERRNVENPELYPIWPFRIFGLERPMLEEARNAFHLRTKHLDVGWGYDGNAAALLGLTDESALIVKTQIANSNSHFRWPAMWGPNYDWVPDQCHGGNTMNTINNMLLQHVGEQILIFPAWPQDWDVSFKLHATRQTTVEAKLENGRLVDLKVDPASRRKDIVLPSWLE